MAIFFALLLTAQAPYSEFRIGRIIIEGNTATPDRVIMDEIHLRPGRMASISALRAAEQRLREAGIFKSNPWRGSGPTLELAPNDLDNAGFKDVLVRVEERRGNWLAFGITEVTLAYLQSDHERLVEEMLLLALRISKAFGNRN